MKAPLDDYEAAQTLTFGLVDFAQRNSGNEADFAAGLALNGRHEAAGGVSDRRDF